MSAASAMPDYSAILSQLMGAPPPSSMGMFGKDPTKAFGQMTDAANLANYNRGNGILQLLSQQGATSKANNADLFAQEKSGIDQSMMDKGLSNLTVGDSLKAGATRDLARANAGVDEATAGNLANMANSFTQQAPDMGLLASLMSKGGGGGTGYGGWNHGLPQQGGIMVNTGTGAGGLNAPGMGKSSDYNNAFNYH